MVEFFDGLGEEGKTLNRFGSKRPVKFVIRTHLQSTLRDLHGHVTSPRLLGTFAVVVLLFAVTGPFGTLAQMNFAERLGYWLAQQAGAWILALTLSALADGMLQAALPVRILRFMVGSLAAAPLIGLYVTGLDALLFGWPFDSISILKMTLEAVPLCLLFCVLSYLTAGPQLAERPEAGATSVQPAVADTPEGLQTVGGPAPAPALLARLKPENRGALLHLSVEDHYTVVTTVRGRELLLLRFADAIAETAPVPGLQVHRSHWVADQAVEARLRRQGKLLLRTRDGAEIPVSRPYMPAVRSRFAETPG